MSEPAPIELTTARLVLRPASPSDAESVAAYFTRNRAHFAPWDPRRADAFFSAEWWRARLEQEAASGIGSGVRFFALEHDRNGPIVGHASFNNVVRGPFQCCHLGFAVDAEREGRGLMREALERAIAWAFDDYGLHRIEANHRPENVRSARLLRRLGFVPQGYARDYLYIDGTWHDHVLTALVNPRWSPPDPG